MREGYGRVERKGAQAGVITLGTAEQTAQLCHRYDAPFTCLSDRDRQGYRAYGLERGSIAQVMGPVVLMKAMASALRGNFARQQIGQDVFQMPGTFAIGSDGVIRYCHRNRDASDNPSLNEVLATL